MRLRDDAADQRPVRLPLQALPVPGEQPAQGQRGRRPLDEHGVRAGGRAVADQDHPPPVLALRADRRDQPARRLVVNGPAGQTNRAAPRGEAVQQPARIGPAGREGQHPMRQVGQDHRPSGQGRRLLDDFLRRGPGDRKLGEHLVQALRDAQLVELGIDDPGVHRLGDLDERHLMLECDQRQSRTRSRGDQRSRQRPGVAPPELHGQPGHADVGQFGDVGGQQPFVVGQGDPGAEHQLPAPEQAGHVGELDRVHPPDRRIQPVGPGHDRWAATAAHLHGEHFAERGKHLHSVRTTPKAHT